MKKVLKFLCFAFICMLGSLAFAGCGGTSTIIFYLPDGSVFETLTVKQGTKITDVNYQNRASMAGYKFIGWYSYANNNFKYLNDVDISKENFSVGSDSVYKYVALMEIKDEGWIYEGSGTNANAFVWEGENRNHATPAIMLNEGDNYIRFDKEIATKKLQYCEVFENGGSGNYVESMEIFDHNGIKLKDIDVAPDQWENLEQQEADVGSFIIIIKATTRFEAGITIGATLD